MPNLPRNKNMERLILDLLEKKWFFGLQNIVVVVCKRTSFFSNFECYDLTNGKEKIIKN